MKQPAIKPAGMTCEMAQRAIALAAMSSHEAHELPDENHFFEEVVPRPGGVSSTLTQADEHGSPDRFDQGAGRGSHPRETALGSGAGPLPLSLSSPESRPPDRPYENEALAEHLATCRSCQAEMAETTAFFRALASDAGPEPSPTLLARARMQLDATLDSCERASWWDRLAQQLTFTAGRIQAAPLLCSALLLIGALGGAYGGYRAGHAVHTDEQMALLLAPPAPELPSVVADVSSIQLDQDTGMVQVRYDRLVPDMLTASISDPAVRELLMAATGNGTSPQVRNVSVGLLSGACGGNADCAGNPVRNALMNALETDKTPEVRREAMASLQPFVADDMEVRDAVLAALMNDPSGSVRLEAVRLLQPVGVDSSVRQVLYTVASHDGDPSIRSASLAALKTVPQIQ